MTHLWTKHIKPLAAKTFYTKKQSDGRYVRTASVRTGYASCPADAFQEENSGYTHSSDGGRRFSLSGGGGYFVCGAALPHGATVTAFRATLHDESLSGTVHCVLTRADLTSGGVTEMAAAASQEETPGTVRVTSSTITNPTVNNNLFAYASRCAINGEGSNLGFYGTSVQYRLSGGAGAAS